MKVTSQKSMIVRQKTLYLNQKEMVVTNYPAPKKRRTLHKNPLYETRGSSNSIRSPVTYTQPAEKGIIFMKKLLIFLSLTIPASFGSIIYEGSITLYSLKGNRADYKVSGTGEVCLHHDIYGSFCKKYGEEEIYYNGTFQTIPEIRTPLEIID